MILLLTETMLKIKKNHSSMSPSVAASLSPTLCLHLPEHKVPPSLLLEKSCAPAESRPILTYHSRYAEPVCLESSTKSCVATLPSELLVERVLGTLSKGAGMQLCILGHHLHICSYSPSTFSRSSSLRCLTAACEQSPLYSKWRGGRGFSTGSYQRCICRK